jgi:hypothetical protein
MSGGEQLLWVTDEVLHQQYGYHRTQALVATLTPPAIQLVVEKAQPTVDEVADAIARQQVQTRKTAFLSDLDQLTFCAAAASVSSDDTTVASLFKALVHVAQQEPPALSGETPLSAVNVICMDVTLLSTAANDDNEDKKQSVDVIQFHQVINGKKCAYIISVLREEANNALHLRAVTSNKRHRIQWQHQQSGDTELNSQQLREKVQLLFSELSL